MNKAFLSSALAFTTYAFPDGNVTLEKDQPGSEFVSTENCEFCQQSKIAPNLLTDSRPCHDLGFYVFADPLYWHADVDNTDREYLAKQITMNEFLTPINSSGPNQQLAFKWDWGYRVGLGIDFAHDQWDANIYYTGFQNTSDKSSFTVPASGGVNVLNGAVPLSTDKVGAAILSGSAIAKLHFNVIDVELGRFFKVSPTVSLRPHVGAKAAWIKLTEKDALKCLFDFPISGLIVPGVYHINNTNKSWALGPSIGVNSSWFFGTAIRQHFSIFGDLSGALMFSHFQNKHTEFSRVSQGGFSPLHLNRNLLVPMLSGIMGLAWDTCMRGGKMHCAIRAGYELQYWFRQSQRIFFSNFESNYIRSEDDLGLQGLTLDVRFDF